MSRRIVTVGELTLDDVVVEGSGCQWAQPGGGALYSAIGALAWEARPAVSATIGRDYPSRWLQRLNDAGIDTAAVTTIEGPGLGLWLLYERGGRRHQVAKESGSSFAVLDGARQPWSASVSGVEGVHVAPQTTQGQLAALAEARHAGVQVTQDLLVEPFVDPGSYRSGAAIRGAHAFLPSEQEVRQVWDGMGAQQLFEQLRASAGIEHLAVKRGAAGVDVVVDGGVVRVPAAAREPVDVTGAGDAFCGGFLVGLLDTGDPVEAAVRGTVSAALVVETSGALEALEHLRRARVQQRANEVRSELARR